jgi:hypothetical protein
MKGWSELGWFLVRRLACYGLVLPSLPPPFGVRCVLDVGVQVSGMPAVQTSPQWGISIPRQCSENCTLGRRLPLNIHGSFCYFFEQTNDMRPAPMAFILIEIFTLNIP